jgi:uncharacterized protein YbaA (DUF1428 family)
MQAMENDPQAPREMPFDRRRPICGGFTPPMDD